jgi:hypothetical protein
VRIERIEARVRLMQSIIRTLFNPRPELDTLEAEIRERRKREREETEKELEKETVNEKVSILRSEHLPETENSG